MARPAIWLALGAISISPAAAWALTPHDKAVGVHVEQKSKQPSATQQHGDTAESEQPFASAQNDAKASREREEDRSDKFRGDMISAVIGASTIMILIGQTVVFSLQALRLKQTIETMKGLGEQQSRDMKLSLSHAETSANAALASVEMAKVEFIASHRAWIKVEARLLQFHIADQCAMLTCFVSGVNIGFSPSVMTDIIFDEYDAINIYDNAETVFNKLNEKRKIMRFPGGVVFPHERTHEAGISIQSPLIGFENARIRRIIVGIFYKIAGDSEERITINAFDLIIKKNIVSEPTIDDFALSGTIVGFAT